MGHMERGSDPVPSSAGCVGPWAGVGASLASFLVEKFTYVKGLALWLERK